ncbi:MAG: hypothetical protein ACKVP0_13735 [Pirellulaceae bacterium]
MLAPSYLRLTPLLLLVAMGCSNLRLPAIDPTGRRIFSGGSTTLAGPDCLLLTHPAAVTTTTPVIAGPAIKPPCNPPLAAAPPMVAVPIVAVPVIAAPAPIQQPACGPQGCPNGPQLKVCPGQLVAPVGSEVIVTAGLCGASGYYLTKQPLEWMLAPDGVGQIVEVGEQDRGIASYFRSPPHKIGPNYVRGHTSTIRQVVNRGTPSPMDDVAVEKGQSWISVTSPTEGTSSITVWAPAEGNWEKRRQTATILWVDAKWKYPAPAIVRSGAGGKHILTTQVIRSSGAPVVGWIVRYDVLEGPDATFGGAGQKSIEMKTQNDGTARAELLSTSGQSGITAVRVQIIRPQTRQGDIPTMVVGQGLTSVTWSSPGLHAQAVGPEVVALNGTVNYQVKVFNSGDVAARDVKLSFTPPSGVTFLNASPSPGAFGQMLQWRLGDLQPGTATVVDLNCRASMAADIRAKFRAESAEKLVSEANVNTKVFASALSVKSSSPTRVEVGQEVQFKVEVTNTGRTPLSNVTITDNFDPGLTHTAGEVSPIVKSLDSIAPNETKRFAVTFRVDQPGKLCHRLDVMADGGHSAATTGCVEAVAASGAITMPTVSVLVSGPRKLEVGKKDIARIEIKNGSNSPLTNLRLTASFPKSLAPIRATGGAPVDEEGLSWLIARLIPGESVVKEIEFEGASVDPRAVVKARLTFDQAPVQTSEATINVTAAAITPPRAPGSGLPGVGIEPPANAGNLKVNVAALNEPIGVGMQVTYRIELENQSTQADDDVAITLILPDGLKFKSLAPGDKYPVISSSMGKYEISPIRTVRASEKLTALEVKATGEKVGPFKFQVEVRSKRNPKPIVTEVTTRVN